MKCPLGIKSPKHYREDGTCLCMEPADSSPLFTQIHTKQIQKNQDNTRRENRWAKEHRP